MEWIKEKWENIKYWFDKTSDYVEYCVGIREILEQMDYLKSDIDYLIEEIKKYLEENKYGEE